MYPTWTILCCLYDVKDSLLRAEVTFQCWLGVTPPFKGPVQWNIVYMMVFFIVYETYHEQNEQSTPWISISTLEMQSTPDGPNKTQKEKEKSRFRHLGFHTSHQRNQSLWKLLINAAVNPHLRYDQVNYLSRVLWIQCKHSVSSKCSIFFKVISWLLCIT